LVEIIRYRKATLLYVAKNYVSTKENADAISINDYNKDLNVAMNRIESDNFHSQEQVATMSKKALFGL
jgi:hypothetical protein